MSEIQKVKWANKYPAKISADIAYREIQNIRKANGGVATPTIVALKAKSKRNPLHKQIYQLSAEDAAFEHYKDESKKLLRSIHIIYKDAPKIETRAYQVVTEPAKRDQPERKVYRTTEEILRDPVMRSEVLQEALDKLASLRRKYAHLSELTEVFHAIDDYLLHADAG